MSTGSKSASSKTPASLRERAEALLRNTPGKPPASSPNDLEALIHELRVQQAKLEIQNEELRSAQVELADSRDRFADLYEFAPIGYIETDCDCIILETNLAAATLLDVPREQLIGSAFTKYVKPESQDTLYLHRQTVVEDGGRHRCRVEMRRGDGKRLVLRIETIAIVQHGVQHCRSALIDSTDSVLAEEALQALNANLEREVQERSAEVLRERSFLDAILDNQSVITLVVDTDGNIVRYNRACEEATRQEFANMQSFDWDLVPEDEREQARRAFELLVAGESPVIHENHWYCRDGSKRLFLWHNTTFEMVPEQDRYIICSGIDITEQRRAEEEARSHLEEAARLQRLHTANELATMLAHELNQPFGAITTFADASLQLLDRESPDLGQLTQNLRRISEEGLRGGEIIQRLRNFIKRGEIEPGEVDLNAVVEHGCEMMSARAGDYGIELVPKLDAELPPVRGVEVHLEQIMLNLLRNAVEAIHDASSSDRLVEVETRRVGGMARVTVRDGGPGIDAKAAEKIFEFLHSTKDYGLGVGLQICRSLIEAHGGRLWIQPQQPGGIVHFEVPLLI